MFHLLKPNTHLSDMQNKKCIYLFVSTKVTQTYFFAANELIMLMSTATLQKPF